MPRVDFMSRCVSCSILYFGAPGAGVSTSVGHFHSRTATPQGKAQTYDRQEALTTDFRLRMPELSPVKRMETILALKTVPVLPEVMGKLDWPALLEHMDGIVFVVDSRPERLAESRAALDFLEGQLRSCGMVTPIVFFYNKRDLPSISSVDELNAALNPSGRPWFDGVATQGSRVSETLTYLAWTLLAAFSPEDFVGKSAPRTPAEALVAWEKAERDERPSISEQLSRARLYERVGRIDKALDALGLALYQDVSCWDIYRELYGIYLRQGRLDAATSVARVLANATQASSDMLDLLNEHVTHPPPEGSKLDSASWEWLCRRASGDPAQRFLSMLCPLWERTRNEPTAPTGSSPPTSIAALRSAHPTTEDPRFGHALVSAMSLFGPWTDDPSRGEALPVYDAAWRDRPAPPGPLRFSSAQLAFQAGREAARRRPENGSALGPVDPTELKVLYYAGITAVLSEADVPLPELNERIASLATSLRRVMTDDERAALHAAASAALPVSHPWVGQSWRMAIEYTCVRAGLLMCSGDTSVVLPVLMHDPSGISQLVRPSNDFLLAEAMCFVVSDAYFRIRERLGYVTVKRVAEGVEAETEEAKRAKLRKVLTEITEARTAREAREAGEAGEARTAEEVAEAKAIESVAWIGRIDEVYKLLDVPMKVLVGDVRFANGEPASVVFTLFASVPTPTVIGIGLARGPFCVTVAPKEYLADERPTEFYAVYSVLDENRIETPRSGDTALDFLIPVKRQKLEPCSLLESLEFMARNEPPEKMRVVLPFNQGDTPIAPPGLHALPPGFEPRKLLRLENGGLQFYTELAASTISSRTGWNNLLEGVRFEIVDDFTDALTKQARVALGREAFTSKELAQIGEVARGFTCAATWDPFLSVVYLYRGFLEYQSFDYLVLTLGHELVHVGQTKNCPGVDAEYKALVTAAWARRLSTTAATAAPVHDGKVFGLMANVEGYAHYIETDWLQRTYASFLVLPWPGHSGFFQTSDVSIPPVPAASSVSPASRSLAWSTTSSARSRERHKARGVEALTPAKAPTWLDALDAAEEKDATLLLETVLRSLKLTQYHSGCEAYRAREPSGADEAVRFDPALRPEPILTKDIQKELETLALKGWMPAQAALGDLFRTGRLGVPVDPARARTWYRLAAKAGSVYAQQRLENLG